jgi:hypothetical protein
MIVQGTQYNKLDFFILDSQNRYVCTICKKVIKSYRGRRTHLTMVHPDVFGLEKPETEPGVTRYSRAEQRRIRLQVVEWYNSSGWNRTEVRR